MKLRMFLTLVGLAIVFGGIFGYKVFVARMTEQALSNRPPPTHTITAMEAPVDTWRERIRSVGSLSAVQGVEVTTEIDGRVTEVAVADGAEVARGDVLVRLNADGLEADLRAARAEARLAEIELERQQRLRRQNANSESDVDRAESELEQARGRVGSIEASLAKKTIEAPFAGRIGIVDIDVGQYLGVGSHIVTLQTLDPIRIDFSVPQGELARIAEGQTVTARVETHPEAEFTGEITAISPRVAQSTRNVDVRARVSNPEGRLRPGMFVQAAVQLPAQNDMVTLPQTAITYNPYGDSVFLINEAQTDAGETRLTVERKFVRTGSTRGDQVQILEGVEPGERVVTSGQVKLRNGSRVEVDNSVEPANEAAPEVGNR